MLKSRQAFEPGTARAQKRPQTRSLKLRRGAFCAAQMPNLPTKRTGGRAGGGSWGGPGWRRPPTKPCATQQGIDPTESTDGTEHDGDRPDRTEYLP
eukprot:11925264-Alexandrium_andersonii.AAC.1